MTERRKLTTLDKLTIVLAQGRCALCGEKLTTLADTHFDHAVALGIGGADTLENLQAVHVACHNLKTNGRPATTYGSDKHIIAKTKRLAGEGKPKQKRAWPKRPMQRRQGR